MIEKADFSIYMAILNWEKVKWYKKADLAANLKLTSRRQILFFFKYVHLVINKSVSSFSTVKNNENMRKGWLYHLSGKLKSAYRRTILIFFLIMVI